MIVVLVLALVVLASLFLVVGVSDVAWVATRRRRLIATAADDEDDVSPLVAWDRVFRTTRLGRWTEEQLLLAGEEERKPLAVLLVAVGGGVAVGWGLAVGLAPVFGVLGVVAVVVGIRMYLARARERRNEAFVAQMPELARVMSNATGAGLSIASAVAVAATELSAPAGPEMARVASRLRFGDSLDTAMKELEVRLPSREVAVLVSTVLVSARSGGSLVTSLRDVADTLEERKEIRREVRTLLAQSTATGYLVIALGFGLLFMLNMVQPGTVEKMTGDWLGRSALVAGSALFVGGFLAIRRIARFDG